MAVLAFICSVAVTGAVASLVGDEKIDTTAQADYHYVPAAGDVFGA